MVRNGMWNADVLASRTLFVEALLLAPMVAAMLALQGDKGHFLWASLPGLVLSKAAQGQPVLPHVLTSLC